MHVIFTYINSPSFGNERIISFIHARSFLANNDSTPKWTKSVPAGRLPCFRGTEWTLDIIILLKRYLSSNELRKLTVNSGKASGFRGKIMLKRVLLNKLPYTFNGYFFVNDHFVNDVRVIEWFLGVPNLRRSSPFYIFMRFSPGISLLNLSRFVA